MESTAKQRQELSALSDLTELSIQKLGAEIILKSNHLNTSQELLRKGTANAERLKDGHSLFPSVTSGYKPLSARLRLRHSSSVQRQRHELQQLHSIGKIRQTISEFIERYYLPLQFRFSANLLKAEALNGQRHALDHRVLSSVASLEESELLSLQHTRV